MCVCVSGKKNVTCSIYFTKRRFSYEVRVMNVKWGFLWFWVHELQDKLNGVWETICRPPSLQLNPRE